MARSKRNRFNNKARILPPILSFQILLRAICVFVGLIVFFLTGTAFFQKDHLQKVWSQQQTQSSSTPTYYYNPNEIPLDSLRTLDAVLVLGGGRPSTLYEPPIYVQQRCNDAAGVVFRHSDINPHRTKGTVVRDDDNGRLLPILCLSAGTAHMGNLLTDLPSGLPIWESTSSAAYLQKHHNLSSNVFVETTSYDTIGNAYFARTSHTDIVGWRHLLIITNQFHMERSKAIFDWVFALDSPARAPYKLIYLVSPDIGLTAEVLAARKEKELKSLATVQKYAKEIRSMRQLWYFLNHQHSLYTASKLIEGGVSQLNTTTAELVKKSYGGG